jgi:hypothetical protein
MKLAASRDVVRTSNSTFKEMMIKVNNNTNSEKLFGERNINTGIKIRRFGKSD